MQCLLLSEIGQVKVRINLKRIIDQNGILKNEIIANSLHEVHFTLQLYSHGRPQGISQCSNFFVPKNLFDESIIFNCHYQDLALDAKIAISIWSSAKKYVGNKPLGATVIQLFDEQGQLRQGKYHLFIWPDAAADVEDPSSTPGLANDENIEMLNFISDRLEECDRSNDFLSNKANQALKFRLSFIYRLVPAAFLEIEFPKFTLPVFFADKLSSDYEDGGLGRGPLGQLGQCLEIYDPDHENASPDPLEETYYNLRSERETSSDKLVPTKDQIRSMEKLVAKTFRIQLKPAQKELFFTFRHFLVQDRKYLSCFLNSLLPTYTDQLELTKLLSKWDRTDHPDSLHLLSRQFSLNPAYNKRRLPLPIVRAIRDYAVTIISELKDQELIYDLLFLVQALRYEGDNMRSGLFQLLLYKAANNNQIASLLYWYLRTQSQPLPKEAKAGKEAEKNIRLYQQMYQQFEEYIKENNPAITQMLSKQLKLFQILKKIAKAVKQGKDSTAKKAEMRKRLAEVNWYELQGVTYPMQVGVVLQYPLIEQCTVFSSAMAPMKLTFQAAGERKFTFLFKSGDDLRQDQMVLEMFDLMDRLLKGVNQDYKLTPYKALACSRSDGFVEFVPDTRTFQETNLKEYLQKLEPQAQVMQNYVFSCAGYCAITYFFGIGDRHLQNLLIASSGKMLHIDFGFILGRDPKPYPPPIKIRKDMIEAMGGLQHRNFSIFKTKCLEAFVYLRNHSKIIYNLVFLMLDSGLKDVHTEGIDKLYDKLAVGMNDTEVEKHFLMVLEQCKNAIAAIIADKIHRWASHFK